MGFGPQGPLEYLGHTGLEGALDSHTWPRGCGRCRWDLGRYLLRDLTSVLFVREEQFKIIVLLLAETTNMGVRTNISQDV